MLFAVGLFALFCGIFVIPLSLILFLSVFKYTGIRASNSFLASFLKHRTCISLHSWRLYV